jgi:hypothetical protein
MSGIQNGNSLQVRVKAECAKVEQYGEYGYTSTFKIVGTTEAAQANQSIDPRLGWQPEVEVYVGPSATMRKTVNVLGSPERCVAIGSSDLAFCYTGQNVQVIRSDIPGGWGNALWIRCYFDIQASGFVETQAAAPTSFTLLYPTFQSSDANFHAGSGIGTCQCPVPELQIRGFGVSGWLSVPSCADMSLRSCTIPDLASYNKYYARLRVTCLNSAQTSDWTYAELPVVTEYECDFSTDSGKDTEFECQDGAFCDMSNTTCCLAHFGVKRCPKAAPLMCNEDEVCVASAVQCDPHGGQRLCFPPPAVVATAPSNVVMLSFGVEWIYLQWDAGLSNDCAYQAWIVQYRREPFATGEAQWFGVFDCLSLGDRSQTGCNVTELPPSEPLEFRVKEECSMPEADSSYTYFPIFRLMEEGKIWDIYTVYNIYPTMNVNVLLAPFSCEVLKVTQSDQFSTCYPGTNIVPITRVDMLNGWGELWVRCATVNLFEGATAAEAAAPPEKLEINSPSIS